MAADSELCKCEVRFEDFGDDDAEDKPEVAADLEDNADADEGTAAEGVADADADGGSESSSDYYQPDDDSCDTDCSVEHIFTYDWDEYRRGRGSKPVRPRKLKNRRKHRWEAEARSKREEEARSRIYR